MRSEAVFGKSRGSVLGRWESPLASALVRSLQGNDFHSGYYFEETHGVLSVIGAGNQKMFILQKKWALEISLVQPKGRTVGCPGKFPKRLIADTFSKVRWASWAVWWVPSSWKSSSQYCLSFPFWHLVISWWNLSLWKIRSLPPSLVACLWAQAPLLNEDSFTKILAWMDEHWFVIPGGLQEKAYKEKVIHATGSFSNLAKLLRVLGQFRTW